MKKKYSYIGVVTKERYLPGVYALYYSLKKSGCQYPFHVLIPQNEPDLKKQLQENQIEVIEMDSPKLPAELPKENNIFYWTDTFFKLNVFRLLQFDKIVFLDADMILLHSVDELFEKKHMSAVVAGKCLNPKWNGLNSGLIVIEPSLEDYEGLLAQVPKTIERCKKIGRGFGDQDVIQDYYSSWGDWEELHLSEVYNAMYGFGKNSYFKAIISQIPNATFDDLKVLHFIGYFKPWNYPIHQLLVYWFRLLQQRDKLEWNAYWLYRKYLKEAQRERKRERK